MANEIDQFLSKIAQIESSGGKNTNHKTMESGIHTGEAAIGTYGLMPNTVRELVNRQRLAGDDSLSYLKDMGGQELKEYLSSKPEIERRLAETLARKVLNRFETPEQAAYAWNMGHNLTPEKLKARDFENADYVQKFKNLSENDRSPAVEEDKLKLASEVDAPLPSFSNESGQLSDTPNLLNELSRYKNSLNQKITDVQENQFSQSPELAKIFQDINSKYPVEDVAMMGSVLPKRLPVPKKGTMMIDELTNPGIKIPQVKSKLAQDIENKQKLVREFSNPTPTEKVKEFFKSEQQLGKEIPASADELINPSKRFLSTQLDELPPPQSYTKKIETLDIPLAEKDYPVSDVVGLEARRKALELLKKKY